MHIHACLHVHPHTHTHTHKHPHTNTQTQTQTHTCTHTHMHTHNTLHTYVYTYLSLSGSMETLSNTSKSTPANVRDSRAEDRGGSLAIVLSVTTPIFFRLRFLKSYIEIYMHTHICTYIRTYTGHVLQSQGSLTIPTSRVTPGLYLMLEQAISKAYSVSGVALAYLLLASSGRDSLRRRTEYEVLCIGHWRLRRRRERCTSRCLS